MFRVVFVLLTIAGIVACPFECMAKSAGMCAPARQRVEECSCCQHVQNRASETATAIGPVEPQRRDPAHPGGCGCSCLCKGAVNTASVPKVDLGEQMALSVWFDTSPIAHVDASVPSLTFSGEGPPVPKLGSGRMIRLVLGSLLL